jgi:hypothetical protein
VGFGVLSSYLAALEVFDLELVEARTVATTVMIAVGLYLVFVLEASSRLRSAAVTILCLALGAAYASVLLLPFAREFFALAQPTPAIVLIAAGGVLVALGGLILSSDLFVPGGEGRLVESGGEPVRQAEAREGRRRAKGGDGRDA